MSDSLDWRCVPRLGLSTAGVAVLLGSGCARPAARAQAGVADSAAYTQDSAQTVERAVAALGFAGGSNVIHVVRYSVTDRGVIVDVVPVPRDSTVRYLTAGGAVFVPRRGSPTVLGRFR